jgi:ribonuclease-3
MKLFGRKADADAALEKAIGYRFRDRALLHQALTHRSYQCENPDGPGDNQRLEFLGDAVLGLLTAAHFYERFQDRDEGHLTSLRSQVISGKALAHCARQLRLGQHLRIGKGEERSGGRTRAGILADALEALVGAAYLDGGMRAGDRIFRTVFAPLIATLRGDVWDRNPKGRLQDEAQRRWSVSPEYRTVRRDGPAHAAVFTAEVLAGSEVLGTGTGSRKREAEVAAAEDALRRLGA